MVPDQMTSHIHSFDAREGGRFRISLTYDAPTTAGKTNPQTDTFHELDDASSRPRLSGQLERC